ncbi:GmrSD restriction endonuclease domain-containing protein [Cellulosimicrobium funkei]|uniref:GmrSD restriction endonuclease domain-containing protein n=1 Tax=Cellulosimicrobium funkei TaxID=264251 RepID=UPI0030FBC0FC
MDTNVRTPLQIFNLPQHLVVPLFQRPYVWDEEEQWQPLWQDITRMANLQLANPYSASTHFLGAVVLQAHDGIAGAVPAFNVIDGQQRLTTLQIVLDAVAAVFSELGIIALAAQLQSLTHNSRDFVPEASDQLKIRHTNRDRAAFDEVMNAELPIDHGTLQHGTSKIARAHAFFIGQVRAWLVESGDDGDAETATRRAEILASVLKQGLQLVVIDLKATENSQEIFETLNARGTPLTAADLIKNFVFQRLDAEGADTHKVYVEDWPFERKFWETEIAVGRNTMSRSSIFLNQWLVSRTADEVSTKQTFTLFKYYVEHESLQKMSELLATIKQQADQYEAWTHAADEPDRDLSVVEMCVYRMKVTGIEALKPILLWLHEPGRSIPASVIDQVVVMVESWLMRRLLLRLSLSSMGRVVADVIRVHRSTAPEDLPTKLADHLSRLRVSSTYWPGDVELRRTLQTENVYRRFPRGRLRILLEAVENDLRRPYDAGKVSRRGYPIEHLLPQKWQTYWPVQGLEAEIRRNDHVHRLGNLTLITESLNSAVSNGPWLGEKGKRAKLAKYDVLLLNRQVREVSEDGWDENLIDERTGHMVESLLRTWPAPDGHVGEVDDAKAEEAAWVELKHLVAAGLLEPGTEVRARQGKWSDVTGTLTATGTIIVGDKEFATPSAAGKHVRGSMTNGWMFWYLPDGRRLADIREAYRGSSSKSEDGLKHWDPETDLNDASQFWAQISEPARLLFMHLLDAAPHPVSATDLGAVLGADSRTVAGTLAWPGRLAATLGHHLPSRWIDGTPALYWMDESAAELFAQVIENAGGDA